MSKYTISRNGIIPFVDSTGQIMNMRNIEIGIKVEQEEGETLEQVIDNLNKLYDSQMEIAEQKVSSIQKYKNQLNNLIKLVKEIPNIDSNLIDNIIKKVKSL